jgi:hypothetical protein
MDVMIFFGLKGVLMNISMAAQNRGSEAMIFINLRS